ncbi:MAG: hypothetical protein V2A64_02050 [Candidatus Omnitrophota bacterium]
MLRISRGYRRVLYTLLFLLSILLSSCAAPSRYESRLNGFIGQDKYAQADLVLGDNPNLYGKNNTLLYFLDKGLVCHLAKDYKKSIAAFEKAKLKFDELYTKSLSGILSTWIINDRVAVYCGEDFERVMINVFQSLNYMMLGNLEDALVEARNVDSKLGLINSRYRRNEKNVYKEDAFVRLLMGIFYEANKTTEDYNNAFISYAKAVEIYENDYAENYRLNPPEILKENILAAAKFIGPVEFDKYRAKYGSVKFFSLEEKAGKAEVFLIQYNGFSPVKEECVFPIPLPDGYIVQLAFPRYKLVPYAARAAMFTAKNKRNESFSAKTQLGEDISAIAVKNLDNRKVRVIAKAIASSAGKYLLERQQERSINKKYGQDAGTAFKILSSLFNVVSSRADLRSWQTLPSEIRVARLLLEPGEYNITVTDLDVQNQCLAEKSLGEINLSIGEKKFFVVRSGSNNKQGSREN